MRLNRSFYPADFWRETKLHAAREWLKHRASIPAQCACEQCQRVIVRQAVHNALEAREKSKQPELFT